MNAISNIRYTTIDKLRPGHGHPAGNVNSRKDYSKQEIKDRLASILQFGILQSLCVVPGKPDDIDGPFFVNAGGLRQAAVELGAKTKALPADYPIPIIVRPDWDSATALAASIEENQELVTPHPVTVYEQFAELQRRGKTTEEIIKLFRMTPHEAKRYFALGGLAPKIRDAWRKGDISASEAKAFTLTDDAKKQEQVFQSLKKAGHLYAHSIREALVGDQRDATKFLTFVGKDAYLKAGGKLQEDLFSRREDDADDDDASEESNVVADFPLLVRLVGEKIAVKRDALVKDGWAWACDSDDLPDNARWEWKQIPDASAKTPAEQKAKAGCVLKISHDGKLDIRYGVVKPGDRIVIKDADGKTSIKPKPKAQTAISKKLKERLDQMADRATQDALAAEKHPSDLAQITASLIGSQIVPQSRYRTPDPIKRNLEAINASITPKVMNAALRKRFDAKDYFSSAPKVFVLRAITEAMGGDHAKKFDGKKKVDVWKFALANVSKTGWLPPELRTPHYDGPAAKPTKNSTVKKIAVKKGTTKKAR